MFKYLTRVRDIIFDPLIDDSNIFIFKNIVIPSDKLRGIFLHACMKGQFEFVKYLTSLHNDINIHAYNDYAFRGSCQNGYLHVTQWLINTYNDINIHADNEYGFKSSCFGGHLHVAQWLTDTYGDINIHANDEFAFKTSCE